MNRAVRLAAFAAASLMVSLPAWAAAPVTDDMVRAVATELRCVVCQSLSVADSPSETAHQMRDVIRERLAAGETPDQVKAYFVAKYGDWILLAPPRRGFTLLVWAAPFAGIAVGLVVIGVLVRRWTRRRPSARVGAPRVDDATRARIAKEIAEMDRR